MKNLSVVSVVIILLTAILAVPRDAMAQNRVAGFVKDVAKDVLVDPTTYGPLGVSLLGKHLDWETSQIFFENGHGEMNPNYAVNGPGSKAVSYTIGNRKLIVESLANFSLSVGNNAVISATERLLLNKYPKHRKLVKTIGWIEKVAVNGYIGYESSHLNFRQWRINEDRARQLGYK